MYLLIKENGRRHFLKEYSDNMEEIFIDKIHNTENVKNTIMIIVFMYYVILTAV